MIKQNNIIIFLCSLIFSCNVFSSTTESPMMHKMYLNFGMGMGSSASWSKAALAVNAMTMGIFIQEKLAIEAGMDMFANGIYQNKPARSANLHFAGKGQSTLNEYFTAYVKAGVGTILGQGQFEEYDKMQSFMTTNVGPYYGAGIKLKLFEQVNLFLEDAGIIVVQSNQRFTSMNQVILGLDILM